MKMMKVKIELLEAGRYFLKLSNSLGVVEKELVIWSLDLNVVARQEMENRKGVCRIGMIELEILIYVIRFFEREKI